MIKKSIHKFDRIAGRRIAKMPPQVKMLMLAMSFLGQPIFILAIGTFILGFGFGAYNKPLTQAGFVAVGTLVIASLLKMILRRDRPATDYVEHMFADTFSFPSGHAAGTLSTFGLVAYLIAGLNLVWSIPFAIVATICIFLIGVSRVYLGAHYPSDVVGGWIVGAVGLILIAIIQPTL